MILLIIYVVGYVLSYLLGRYNIKSWGNDTYGDYPYITYSNEDMLFNLGVSIASWFGVLTLLIIIINRYIKNHKPKILANISDWYFIWKNEESKL